MGDGVEPRVEEGRHDEDGQDPRPEARDAGAGHGPLDLLEDRQGMRRPALDEGDAHREQHAAEQRLCQEGLELGRGRSALEVHPHDVGGEEQGDGGGEEEDVRPEDRVELHGPQNGEEVPEHVGDQRGDGDGLPRAQDAVAQGEEPAGDERRCG